MSFGCFTFRFDSRCWILEVQGNSLTEMPSTLSHGIRRERAPKTKSSHKKETRINPHRRHEPHGLFAEDLCRRLCSAPSRLELFIHRLLGFSWLNHVEPVDGASLEPGNYRLQCRTVFVATRSRNSAYRKCWARLGVRRGPQ